MHTHTHIHSTVHQTIPYSEHTFADQTSCSIQLSTYITHICTSILQKLNNQQKLDFECLSLPLSLSHACIYMHRRPLSLSPEQKKTAAVVAATTTLQWWADARILPENGCSVLFPYHLYSAYINITSFVHNMRCMCVYNRSIYRSVYALMVFVHTDATYTYSMVARVCMRIARSVAKVIRCTIWMCKALRKMLPPSSFYNWWLRWFVTICMRFFFCSLPYVLNSSWARTQIRAVVLCVNRLQLIMDGV